MKTRQEKSILNTNRILFISFDDLWKTFGNGGPLLEFIYLINHSMTLEAKINNQITRIGSEIDEREWFNVLAVIAIAGQYDLSIKLDVLFEKIKLRNASKLLQQFEKRVFCENLRQWRKNKVSSLC